MTCISTSTVILFSPPNNSFKKMLNAFDWLLVLLCLGLATHESDAKAKPNFILMHLDDVGYGDFSFYTSLISRNMRVGKISKTPQLDRLAQEGIAFSSYYASACVCTPSRAGILTGRYPIRTTAFPGVFGPDDDRGLPPEEITIARWLKEKANYQTFMVGKWHLGHRDPYLPVFHGFEKWTGMPYSHDYCPCPSSLTNTADNKCRTWNPPCPLMNGTLIVQQPTILDKVVDYYVAALIEYIDIAAKVNRPWFAYYACHHTHHPQFVKKSNIGKSREVGGRDDAYGDSVWEMDDAIGRIAEHLRKTGLQDNTYILVASDNGAAPVYGEISGSNAPLRCGKGTTWEGGQRVPFIVWGGQTLKGKILNDTVAGMDVFPTISTLAGVPMNSFPRVMDGIDFSGLLLGTEPKEKREVFFYYSLQGTLDAVRVGRFKVHFRTNLWVGEKAKDCHPPHISIGTQIEPLVYDLIDDPGEHSPLGLGSKIRKSQIAAATKAMRSHNCSLVSSKVSNTCDASRLLRCYSPNQGQGSPLAPWPPEPFRPWSQKRRACCPHGYDIVVPEWTDPAKFSCTPNAGKCHREAILCNPSVLILPTCKGRAICATDQGDMQVQTCGYLVPNENGKLCDQGSIIQTCPATMLQCRNRADNGDAMCTSVAKHCDIAGGVVYGARPCGSCQAIPSNWSGPVNPDTADLMKRIEEDMSSADEETGDNHVEISTNPPLIDNSNEMNNNNSDGEQGNIVLYVLLGSVAAAVSIGVATFLVIRRHRQDPLAHIKYHKQRNVVEPEQQQLSNSNGVSVH